MVLFTALAWIFFAAGILFRHFLIPNQILIIAAGVFLLVFGSLVSILKENLQADGDVPVLWHKIEYGLAVLVFWGYLQGRQSDIGLWAGVFYAALGLVALYFAAILWKARVTGERRKQFRNLGIILASLGLLGANFPMPTQLPDMFYRPSVDTPAYSAANGPVVLIDEGHNNFHTMGDKYKPFADLLRQDGCRPRAFKTRFRTDDLASGKILVVSNALHPTNVDDWTRPGISAFTPEEIAAVRNWVWNGGSLFLIADHAPFAGAARELAAEFGFEFRNGYASHPGQFPDLFTRKNGMLKSCVLTDGASGLYRVDQVRTFVGQAFSVPDDAVAVLVLDSRYRLWHSAVEWRRRNPGDADPAEGLAQLACKEFGHGRVVVAGEAAMFSAQLDGGRSWLPMGMNAAGAEQNWRLALNVIRWLEGASDKGNPAGPKS